VSQPWHNIVEDCADRNSVAATLTRIGQTDTEVAINVMPMQYTETQVPTGGNVVQQTRRWVIPARRLAATGYPVPVVPGDILRIASLGLEARVGIVGPGIAGGEVVRWDITEEGVT
jgi:hypothetical protein